MRLYLVRHGEASASDPNQALTAKGVDETKQVAALLKKGSLKIDALLHSPKLRAKQTAEIMGGSLFIGGELKQHAGLNPNDPVLPFSKEIPTLGRHVMVVSHLPFLEKLLALLLFSEERSIPFNLSNACVISLENQGGAWQLLWMVNPELANGCFV